MKPYKIKNIKCEGCVNTIKKRLEPIFGKIDIDLSVEPKILTVFSNHFDEKKLRKELLNLGYPMSDEKLNFSKNITTKTKSFISCAIGKID